MIKKVKKRITLLLNPFIAKQARGQAVSEEIGLTELVEKALIAYLPKETVIKRVGMFMKNGRGSLSVCAVLTFIIALGGCDLGSSSPAPPVYDRSPVNLGTAGAFVILAKSGIATVPASVVTGNIGVSPIDATGMTGFSLNMDASNRFSTSAQIVGRAYAADYAPPTPSAMTTAVSAMETAYTDAAGRSLPDATELGAGNVSGLTLAPGVYKWGTSVLITTNVTLSGGPTDVWIFQIAQGLTLAPGATVTLAGGARPENVFWQCFGVVTINTTAHLEGIVLAQTAFTLATGATVNGRLLSQTAVTLDASVVTQPAL